MVLCGVLGLGFFALTDPHVTPSWIRSLGWGANLVDAAHDALAGTLLGVAGALVIISIGLWLVLRRAV